MEVGLGRYPWGLREESKEEDGWVSSVEARRRVSSLKQFDPLW